MSMTLLAPRIMQSLSSVSSLLPLGSLWTGSLAPRCPQPTGNTQLVAEAMENLEPASLLEASLRNALRAHSAKMPTPAALDGVGFDLSSNQSRKIRGDGAALLNALAGLLGDSLACLGPGLNLRLRCEDFIRQNRPYVTIRVGVLTTTPQTAATAGNGASILTPPNLEQLQAAVARHHGWLAVNSNPDAGWEIALTLPAAMTPSRYKPLSAKITLATFAATIAAAAPFDGFSNLSSARA